MDQRHLYKQLKIDIRATLPGSCAQDGRLYVPTRLANGESGIGDRAGSSELELVAERLGTQLGLVSPQRERRDRGDRSWP